MNFITINPALTASISLYGYMFDKTTNVFLSSNRDISPFPLTAVDHFSYSRRVSAVCPPFSGMEVYTYEIVDSNRMVVYLHNVSGNGYVDIIWYNRAGYTKLSDEDYLLRFFND